MRNSPIWGSLNIKYYKEKFVISQNSVLLTIVRRKMYIKTQNIKKSEESGLGIKTALFF